MESRTIQLTEAAKKHGNLNIRACGKDFFPPDVFGGSSKKAGLGTPITLRVEGLPEPIKTDIPTDKKTEHPRWIFRERAWTKKFVKVHNLKTDDTVRISRIDNRTYEVIPDNNHGQRSPKQLLEKMGETQQITREEKRVVLYAKDGKPTVSSEVTHKIPLERLNLNWRESDLREKERTKHVHRLHPYLGKYIPQLVEIFLRKFFSPEQTVLDPFAGSCTTLVQANELGINSIGYDVSAFNILLGRVKTTKYDLTKVQNEVLDILAKVQTATQTDHAQKALFDTETSTETVHFDNDNEYLKAWFAPQSLQELLSYRHFIKTSHYEYTDLLKVILSRSARSARLTTHFDLDFPKRPQTTPYWCYKHSRECTPIAEAYKFLRRYSIDSLKRIKEFSLLRTDAKVELHHADSRKADIPPIDGVMTSPPYVGLIDYHEQHAYGYHLLGLEDNRHDEIGPAANGSSRKAKQEYQQDIAQVLSRTLASMPSGGYMIVVAGDRANLYDEIARLIGVEVEAVVQRHVNRRTGRRANEFFESVFIWKKP